MITKQQITRLKELYEKATQGEWEPGGEDYKHWHVDDDKLICEMHNCLPALLEAAEWYSGSATCLAKTMSELKMQQAISKAAEAFEKIYQSSENHYEIAKEALQHLSPFIDD